MGHEQVGAAIEVGPAVAPSDPHEIGFLPPRQGTQLSHPVIQSEVVNLRIALEDDERRRAETSHRLGSKLLFLYSRFAERTMGYSSFSRFVEQELGLDHRRVSELLLFAHRVTEAEARQFTYTQCLAGVALMELTNSRNLTALAKKELALPDGRTIRFPAPVRDLKAAIAQLRSAPALPTRTPLRQLSRVNDRLQTELTRERVLDGVGARYYVDKGGRMLVRVGALAPEQFDAFARVLRRMSKSE